MTPRQFERGVRADLIARRWLRWHCMLIATLTLLAAWACTHALLNAGAPSMALRWGVAFGMAYLTLIGLLYLWGRWLLSRDEGSGDPGIDGGAGSGGSPEAGPEFHAGGGGDFGGAGGGGSFELPDGAADAAGTALEGLAAADEGIVVLVPLAVLAAVAAALAAVLGFAVFGLFGVEVLLGVAVEIAFASVGGALAVKAAREGWLLFALRRTWAPALWLLVGLVGVGFALDTFVPGADSLPQVLRVLKSPA